MVSEFRSSLISFISNSYDPADDLAVLSAGLVKTLHAMLHYILHVGSRSPRVRRFLGCLVTYRYLIAANHVPG